METLHIIPARPEPEVYVGSRFGHAWLIGAAVQDFVFDQMVLREKGHLLFWPNALGMTRGWKIEALLDCSKRDIPQPLQVIRLLIGENSRWLFTAYELDGEDDSLGGASFIGQEYAQTPGFPSHYPRAVAVMLGSAERFTV